MSDNPDIEFRRLVSDIAANLSREEVERVAYIRLRDSQSRDKYNAKEPGATGLNLLATLECLRVFSQQNVDGLWEIAKDVDRRDLMGRVEEYKAKRSHAAECARKKPRRLLKEDQQQLDKKTIAKLAALQKHVSLLQRALNKRTDEQDEAFELLRSMEEIVQTLRAQQPLSSLIGIRSRNDSSSSSSNGSGGVSEGSTASSPTDTDTTPTIQEVPSASGKTTNPIKKPVPKKRRHFPIQESAMPSAQLPLPLECQDKEPTGYMHSVTSGKPQIHPRKITMQLATGNTDAQDTVNQLPNRDTVEVEDNTGDSGMGTGSETGPYSTVDAWRQGMSNPPPQAMKEQLPEHTYQPIISENREPDTIYKDLKRE